MQSALTVSTPETHAFAPSICTSRTDASPVLAITVFTPEAPISSRMRHEPEPTARRVIYFTCSVLTSTSLTPLRPAITRIGDKSSSLHESSTVLVSATKSPDGIPDTDCITVVISAVWPAFAPSIEIVCLNGALDVNENTRSSPPMHMNATRSDASTPTTPSPTS